MNDNYEIILNYDKETDISKLFETLHDFTLALSKYNNMLVGFVSKEIVTTTSLLEINNGSIKTKIQDFIKKLPEDSKLDFYVDNPKEIIKTLLKDGRKILFKLVDLDETQEKKEEFLYAETDKLFKNSDLSNFGYKIKKDELFKNVNDVYKPLKNTSSYIEVKEDNIKHTLKDCFNYSMEKTYKNNTTENTFDAKLKIKKPALIGKSKWEFVYERHTIDVEIKDESWLEKLQNREIGILFGDIIYCNMKSKIIRNDENEIIESNYYILKVHAVLAPENDDDEYLIK